MNLNNYTTDIFKAASYFDLISVIWQQIPVENLHVLMIKIVFFNFPIVSFIYFCKIVPAAYLTYSDIYISSLRSFCIYDNISVYIIYGICLTSPGCASSAQTTVLDNWKRIRTYYYIYTHGCIFFHQSNIRCNNLMEHC